MGGKINGESARKGQVLSVGCSVGLKEVHFRLAEMDRCSRMEAFVGTADATEVDPPK